MYDKWEHCMVTWEPDVRRQLGFNHQPKSWNPIIPNEIKTKSKEKFPRVDDGEQLELVQKWRNAESQITVVSAL